MTPLLAFALGILTACLCMLFGAGIIVWIFEGTGVLPKEHEPPPYPFVDEIDHEFRELTEGR